MRSSHVSGSAIIATHPRLCCGILIFFYLYIIYGYDPNRQTGSGFVIRNIDNLTNVEPLSEQLLDLQFLLIPIGLAFVNFEVFAFVDITDDLLDRVCEALCDMFNETVYGRCELRCGGSKLFLDFVITRSSPVSTVFATLFGVLGNIKVRLHRGKAQVDTVPFSM